MSLLMFSHQPTEVVVVTDTLATAPGGEPTLFKSKSFIVPHLQMVVAMTGSANVGEQLVAQIFGSLLARDVDMAAKHTQKMLVDIEHELSAANGPMGTSTIYYFGHSELSQQYVRYAFRSTSGFEPERTTAAGFGVKPVPMGDFAPPDSLEDWVALAERIRAEQAAEPTGDRIHIGGELFLTTMANGFITSSLFYRFADIEDQWHAMHDYHDAWTAPDPEP